MPEDKQTIINPPSSGSGAGWAVAVIVLVIVALFLIFGLPIIRRGGINVNVPDKIQIDTNNNSSTAPVISGNPGY
jgi:hypothetical protein